MSDAQEEREEEETSLRDISKITTVETAGKEGLALVEENKRLKDQVAALETAKDGREQKLVASYRKLEEERQKQTALEDKHAEAKERISKLTEELAAAKAQCGDVFKHREEGDLSAVDTLVPEAQTEKALDVEINAAPEADEEINAATETDEEINAALEAEEAVDEEINLAPDTDREIDADPEAETPEDLPEGAEKHTEENDTQGGEADEGACETPEVAEAEAETEAEADAGGAGGPTMESTEDEASALAAGDHTQEQAPDTKPSEPAQKSNPDIAEAALDAAAAAEDSAGAEIETLGPSESIADESVESATTLAVEGASRTTDALGPDGPGEAAAQSPMLAELAAAEQQLAEVNYEKSSLEESLAELQQVVESLKSANRELEGKEAAGSAEIAKLQAEVEKVSKAQGDTGAVEALEKALDKAKKTAAADTKVLQEKLSRKEAESNRKDFDLEDLKQRMRGLQQKGHVADALQARVSQLEKELQHMEAKYERASRDGMPSSGALVAGRSASQKQLAEANTDQKGGPGEEIPQDGAEDVPACGDEVVEAIAAGVQELANTMDGHSAMAEEHLQNLSSRVSSADYRMQNYTEAIHDVVQAKLALESTAKGLTDRLTNSEARCGDQRSAIQALQAQVRSYEEESLTLREHRLTMRGQVRHWQQEAERCRREAARNERAARDLHQLEGSGESIEEFFLKRYSSDSMWATDDFSRLLPTNNTRQRPQSAHSQPSNRPASATNARQCPKSPTSANVRPSSAAPPTTRGRNPPQRSILHHSSPEPPLPASAMAWTGPRPSGDSLNPEASNEFPPHFHYVMQTQRAVSPRPNSAAAYHLVPSAPPVPYYDQFEDNMEDDHDGFIVQEDGDEMETRWRWSSLPADAFRYGYPNSPDRDVAQSQQLYTPRAQQSNVVTFGLGASVPVRGQRPRSALAISAASAHSRGQGGASPGGRPAGQRRPATASPGTWNSSANMSSGHGHVSDRKQRARDLWRDVDLRRTHQTSCRCCACKASHETEQSYTELTRDRRPRSFLHRSARR